MKSTEQTIQQIERAIRKIAEKFPVGNEASLMTDIHIRVTQESGELMAFDDDDHEITRCVVEQWIDDKSDDFYEQIADVLRVQLRRLSSVVEKMSVLKPYAFVLESDDGDIQQELYVVDDDTVIIDSNLMDNLDDDLDKFFDNLMKDV